MNVKVIIVVVNGDLAEEVSLREREVRGLS